MPRSMMKATAIAQERKAKEQKKKEEAKEEWLPAAKVRDLYDSAKKELENGCRCAKCGKIKDKDRGFYMDTNPFLGGRSFCRICKDCAAAIALRRDVNGDDHEPTMDSVKAALKILDKPFLNIVWDASVQEAANMVSGKVKDDVWKCYIKNIQMKQYVGLTYLDSDMFKHKIVYEDERTQQDVIDEHSGQDTYDNFLQNKEDVIRLLDYDPFEKERVDDQPFLYSQLLGLMDKNGDSNDDMMRTSACISIVRGFLQSSKIDDSVSKLMADINELEQNSSVIRTLQESKAKIIANISKLAEDNCISLKHSRNAVKGENTWTGKIKRIKDLNLREGQVNCFDINTCKGMQQVQEISDASIMKQLSLDESDWSDMVAELREKRVSLERDVASYKEINRILLKENLDLKDYLEENGLSIKEGMRDLKELYSVFGEFNESEEDAEDFSEDETFEGEFEEVVEELEEEVSEEPEEESGSEEVIEEEPETPVEESEVEEELQDAAEELEDDELPDWDSIGEDAL